MLGCTVAPVLHISDEHTMHNESVAEAGLELSPLEHRGLERRELCASLLCCFVCVFMCVKTYLESDSVT